jgi:hypothetical protein
MPAILADSLPSTSSQLYITNFAGIFQNSGTFVKSINDPISYDLAFYTTNAIPDNGCIKITFPITPTSACVVTYGMEDFSESNSYKFFNLINIIIFLSKLFI